MTIRSDWTLDELKDLYNQPLLGLIAESHRVHRVFHEVGTVQVCSLISVKTGGCSEDCKYCAQSSHYQTGIQASPLMSLEEVKERARRAIKGGATRICLGAAWREVKDNLAFEKILEMVKEITAMGAEVCCTLGMLKEHQAVKLKEAGLYAYNHNLDTSERFYKSIITTRTYQERLDTLDVVEKAGITLCCGAILGLGEEIEDRLEFLLKLCRRDPHPASVPINRLVGIPGTPLASQAETNVWELVRILAIARIVMPKARVRLSAGRLQLSYEQQALCFLAGANSIHAGEKLLTLPNPSFDKDEEMFKILGLKNA